MSYAKNIQTWSHGDGWVLDVVSVQNKRDVACSLSNGDIQHYNIETGKLVNSMKNAHHSTISKLVKIDENLVVSGAVDKSVKVFDLRIPSSRNSNVVQTFESQLSVLSLDYDHKSNLIACGTELTDRHCDIYIFDLKLNSLLRKYAEIQNDDITSIRFNQESNNLLLSGSTDGHLNIIDLNESDEDECLYQLINYDSIHSCGWLNSKAFYGLTHIETLNIYPLNDLSTEDDVEPDPVSFGDLRLKLNCKYIVDFYHDFIAVGDNETNVRMIDFDPEKCKFNISKQTILSNAHGEDICRCLLRLDETTVATGGEDGSLKIWRSDESKTVSTSSTTARKHKSKKSKKSKVKHSYKPY